ncbi:hypothetical protein D3C76_707010 [compost metagenome]
MVEKFSPLLKFSRPSSRVRLAALPVLPSELALEMKSGSAPVVDQLAPIDSDESNLPSISPILKSIALACAVHASATAVARAWGRNARRIVIVVGSMRTPEDETVGDFMLCTAPAGLNCLFWQFLGIT